MTETSIRLTIEQVEADIKHYLNMDDTEATVEALSHLRDTMRENERFREAFKKMEDGGEDMRDIAKWALNSYKESEHGN